MYHIFIYFLPVIIDQAKVYIYFPSSVHLKRRWNDLRFKEKGGNQYAARRNPRNV